MKDGSYAQSYDCHLWDYNTANVGDQKIRIRPLTNGKYKFNFVHTNFAWDTPAATQQTTPRSSNIPTTETPGSNSISNESPEPLAKHFAQAKTEPPVWRG